MDYQWYFPNSNSGSGGGTVIVEGTDYKTITIPITEDMRTAECRVNDIVESTFGWSIEAVAEVEGVETPITVGTDLTFMDYSDTTKSAYFKFVWQNSFKGYINVNYWVKNN